MTRQERKEFNYWKIRRIVNGKLEKQCSVCQQWKEETIENYYLMNKSKPELGYTASCRKCATDKSIERRYEDIEQTRKNDLRYYYDNKDKCFARMNNYKTKNKEAWKKYFASYLKTIPDKLKVYYEKRKIKNHKISDKEWNGCKEYFGNACAYCGLPLEEHYRVYAGETVRSDLHKEHVIDDGRNDIKNCIPSCLSCNTSKHKKTLNEFYNPCNPNYTYERYYKIYLWLRYDYKKYITKKRYYKKKPNKI